MKKIAAFYLLLSIYVLQAQVIPSEPPVPAQAAENIIGRSEEKGARIVFEESSFDFGDITQGDKVQHVFTFTNDGDEALLLVNVRTTCGCTAPSWPKTPVLPGESEKITIAYNSANKIGTQNKTITIESNAVNSPATQLRIRAVVIKQ